MAEGEKREAPRFFSVASWAMAGIGATVFAFTVGFLAYQNAQNPLLASTSQNATSTTRLSMDKCIGGKVAINNYPGGITEKGAHQAYYDKMGEEYWRCTQIKVPEINEDEPCNSAANATVVDAYISRATSGGQKIQIVQDKAAFDALPDNQKKYAVIQSSLKPACVGPNSVDYDVLAINDIPINPVQKNTTYETWKKEQEEAKAKAAAQQAAPAAQPAIGPPSSSQLGAPVTSGSKSQTSTEAEPATGEEGKPRYSSEPVTVLPANLLSSIIVTRGRSGLVYSKDRGKTVDTQRDHGAWVCAVVIQNDNIIAGETKTLSSGKYEDINIDITKSEIIGGREIKIQMAAWMNNGRLRDQYDYVLESGSDGANTCRLGENAINCEYAPVLKTLGPFWDGKQDSPNKTAEVTRLWRACWDQARSTY
ncbi:MAG: hypothetical protein OEV37_02085 [Candidatus Berkelbacteria bacterium]|nr:hypothetical protein [Candidatus Berkelbacteria bacterium]